MTTASRTIGVTITMIGKGAGRETGSQITALGNSVGATTVTAFPNTGLAGTLDKDIGFAFTIYQSSSRAGTLAFSMAGIGSVSLTRGRNTGQTIGMKRTMFTSSTAATVTTCTTGDILP